MTETQERFLHDIATRLPAERVVEVHLFAPIRQGGTESGVAVVALEPATSESVEQRHTVYTAHYRHTLKGLDRGKWEMSVVDEADAPLLTVDVVVRGVQRRAGETDEAIRLDGDEFRAMARFTAAPAA
ncbi:MAG: hypothetical protein JWO05_1256 [Gemmatimonadetes bacterium]|nr:hypothetical protein [Gemmatimonadota bacterium]